MGAKQNRAGPVSVPQAASLPPLIMCWHGKLGAPEVWPLDSTSWIFHLGFLQCRLRAWATSPLRGSWRTLCYGLGSQSPFLWKDEPHTSGPQESGVLGSFTPLFPSRLTPWAEWVLMSSLSWDRESHWISTSFINACWWARLRNSSWATIWV